MRNWPFKSIFVPCFPAETIKSAAIDYAAALAAQSGGHLTVRVMGSRIAMPYSLAGSLAGGYVKTANEAAQTQVDASVTHIKSRYSGGEFVLDATGVMGSHADLVTNAAYHGRLHDLAVTDRLSDVLSEGRAMMEELLFSSGHPVIVVPPGHDGFSARKIIVAWDGSARAARAAHDALPLLAKADAVQLVCVTQDKDPSKSVPGAEFAPFLARHGVTVELRDIPESDSSAGRVLLKHADDWTADMIVMGAFSHTRFRQLVLGGATQDMLENAKIPVFFSH